MKEKRATRETGGVLESTVLEIEYGRTNQRLRLS